MLKRTIDGKTILLIEIEKNSKRVAFNNFQLSSQSSNDLILEKKWMEKEELNEKHLVAAIANKETIPVPHIMNVDESTYNRLYPANFKKSSWRILAEPAFENKIEYDLDSDDDQWLQKQPKRLNLTPEKFEKYFEFLEQNSRNKVPSFPDFYTSFKSNRPIEGLEKVFDYWLDKRLNNEGRKLIPELKRASKVTSKKILDPYVAFRPCREKMHLRKNRHLDRENYVKMIRLRDQMEANVRMWKHFMIQKRVEHKHMTHHFNTFLEQYQKKDFSELYTSDTPVFNTEEIFNELKSKVNDVYSNDEPEVTLESVNSMEYALNSDNDYHRPIKNFPDVDDDKQQKFNSTTNGLVRARVGRGGRIVFDRKFCHLHQSPEFQQYNILGDINLRRCEAPPKQFVSASSFKLSNACNHSFDNFENLRDEFYFEVE